MTLSPSPAVKTAGLSKRYRAGWLNRREVNALEPLTLEVRPGEVFGLLGPNGSGKTTTLKLLLGFLRPSSGTAELLGRPAGDVAVKARLGFLPEETYLHGFLDADETLDFYGSLFGLPKAERKRRADALLSRLGLEKARSRPVREYSKGMARRLGFAQALINDPELLILDEPTSGLDPLGNAEIKDLILELKARGKTLLVSSHLLADMERVCDRIAILYEGRLVETGNVKDLLTLGEVSTLKARGAPPQVMELALDTLRKAGADAVLDHPTETLEAHFLRVVGRQRKPG